MRMSWTTGAQVCGVVVALAWLAPARTSAAEPLKVFCVARPPAADADDKAKKDQEDAPKSAADVIGQLKGRKKQFVLADSAAAADVVIEIISRHQPGLGPKNVTFDVKVGPTTLDKVAIKIPGVWSQVASNLVDAVAEWDQKSGKEIRAALAAPPPLSDADRAALNKTFVDILKQHSWWLAGVDAK